MDYKAQLKGWQKRREKLLAMLASGASRTEAAKALGITRQRIHQIVTRAKSA